MSREFSLPAPPLVRGLVTAAALVLVLTASSSLPQPPASGHDLDAFTHQLDQRVPSWLAQYDVPGVAIALVQNGEVVWSRGYGMADGEQHIPVTPDTVFKSASLSKAVTAWGVMRLVEQGRLELDAPAERYLTRWHLPPSQYGVDGVTIRRLLSHTAGISPHIPPIFALGEELPSPERALSGNGGRTAPVRISMPPGAQYSYTGAGYTILQLIIEEVTGQSFAAYMQHELLDALGMRHSSFDWRTDLRPITAIGYDQDGNPYPNDLVAEQAAAGLYSTAPDLARFVAAGMPGPHGEPAGRGLVSPATVDLMFTPIAEARGIEALTNGTIGLGHFIESLPDGTRAVSHAGTNWGWQLMFMSLPQHGDGIVILTNGTRGIALYTDVLSAWGNWLGTGAPRVARAYQDLRTAVLGLAGLLAVALMLPVVGLVKAVRAGRRQWLWRFSGKPDLRSYASFAATMLIVALLAAAWVFVAHPVLDYLIARLAYWLTAAVLAWCVWGLVSALLRPMAPRRPAT